MAHRRYMLLMLPLFTGCGLTPSDDSVQSVEGGAATVLQHSEWDQTMEAWSEQVADHVAREDVGGVAVGVVVHGDLAWSRGFGLADRDDGTAMEPSAVFRAGSISKAVTAMLLMRLVDRGVVGLDEPVARYLPELASVRERLPRDPGVTFRHLASHTAGLRRNYEEGRAGPIDEWQDGVIRSLNAVAFDTVPGDRYQDSPIGYGALGLALERAAGRPFIELVQTEVFEPLGMTSSTFVVTGSELGSRLATAYPNRKDGTIEDEGSPRIGGAWGYTLPSGGLYSTVGDLGRLLAAIGGAPGSQILSEASRNEMISPQTPGGLRPPRDPGVPTWGPRNALFRDGDGEPIVSPEVLDPPHGLGLSIMVDGDGTIVHSGGLVAGHTAYMALDPETGIGVVILRNYWRGETHLRHAAIGLASYLSDLSGES